jgi:hypothetical protein
MTVTEIVFVLSLLWYQLGEYNVGLSFYYERKQDCQVIFLGIEMKLL